MTFGHPSKRAPRLTSLVLFPDSDRVIVLIRMREILPDPECLIRSSSILKDTDPMRMNCPFFFERSTL